MVQRTTNGEGQAGAGITPALVNSLILYQYRQSRGRLTSGLKSALRLYAHQQQQIRLCGQVAMLNAIVQSDRKSLEQIIIEAQTATPERGMELLKQAKKLQKQMRRIGRKLEELASVPGNS